jgi:hypothetical protein
MIHANRSLRLRLGPALAVLLAILAPETATAQRGTTRTNVNSSASRNAGGSANRGANANSGANRSATANTNRNATANTNANRNVNANANANVNRNVNVNNNVNVNRNIDVDVDNDWNDFDNDWDDHPVARGAAFGAAAAITAAAIGSMVYSLPPSCSPMVVNGLTYQNCGGSWYQPQYAGTQVTYVVVNPPQ